MFAKQDYIPSASVLLLRKQNERIEVLLLKKNSKITFGGSWVFPGGRVDEEDNNDFYSDFSAERRAVARECVEETGLKIDASELKPISVWKTPVTRPKRFSTVFFIYNAVDLNQPIRIDHGEIVESKWGAIPDILTQHDANQLSLAGPAYVTLSSISSLSSIDEIWAYFRHQGFKEFTPRVLLNNNGAICLYQGDEGYDQLNDDSISDCENLLERIESAGARHRLYMSKSSSWKYVNNLSE